MLNQSKGFYIIVSIVAILIIVILVYFGFCIYKKSISEIGPNGFFLLTLKPMIENASSGVYLYSLNDDKLEYFYDKEAVNITGHGLPSGIAVTSSRLLNSIETENKGVFQLYQIDMKDYFKKTQVTNSNTFFKRHAELSPDGQKIAFMARNNLDEDKSFFSPDGWSIYITDLNGNETFLGKGAYPQWAPDSKQLVVLRSDGLYLYDSEKQEGKRIWDMESGKASLNMMIDVSRDGSKLAWSVSSDNQIILMNISSWEPFTTEIYKTIDNIFAFWPVFSPEVDYLAVIVGNENENNVENLHLEIYDLETFESDNVLDLNNFLVTSMSLTDWGYEFK